MPATLAICRVRAERWAAASADYLGTLLMKQHIGHRLIVFDLWSSRAALVETDAEAQDEDRRMSRSGIVRAEPVREILEVLGYS